MITTLDTIRLDGLLPQVFDNGEGRRRAASSDLMLCDTVLRRGSFYCVNASSGSGKTSLCSFIYGVRRDYIGHIYFNDRDIASLDIAGWCDVRRRLIAYLPQELDIFGELSVLDNIRLKNRLTGCKSDDEIMAMLARLEVDNLAPRQAARISVGQRQRVALVRALCQPFDFIMLDEPVSHLDNRNNRLCADLILDEATARGAAIVSTSVGNQLALDAPVISLDL